MWKKYKQGWKEKIEKEIGDRSALQAVRLYVVIFFTNLWILSIGVIALIIAAWFSVAFHILPAELTGEIAGILLICWLFFMIAFSCTKKGERFMVGVGKKIEISILDTFYLFRVSPILPASQKAKFSRKNVAVNSFVPSTPFIPPRLHLA